MTAVFPTQVLSAHLENQLCGQRSVWTNPARLSLLLSCSLLKLCCGQLVCSSPRACGPVPVDLCLCGYVHQVIVPTPDQQLSPLRSETVVLSGGVTLVLIVVPHRVLSVERVFLVFFLG